MAIKQIRIRSRGNTHVYVSHPMLVGILPSSGAQIESGTVFDVIDGRFDDMEKAERSTIFAGTGLVVDFIEEGEDEAATALPDEELRAENEALKERLKVAEDRGTQLEAENTALKAGEQAKVPPASGEEAAA